jgi:hypothetical protein
LNNSKNLKLGRQYVEKGPFCKKEGYTVNIRKVVVILLVNLFLSPGAKGNFTLYKNKGEKNKNKVIIIFVGESQHSMTSVGMLRKLFFSQQDK